MNNRVVITGMGVVSPNGHGGSCQRLDHGPISSRRSPKGPRRLYAVSGVKDHGNADFLHFW